MHPLDVVKTRFQIQTTGKPGDPNYYTSVFDCMRKMARNEGVLSLYKGVLPPVLVETPKRAVKVIHPFPGTPISYFLNGLYKTAAFLLIPLCFHSLQHYCPMHDLVLLIGIVHHLGTGLNLITVTLVMTCFLYMKNSTVF